jgi:hypothetical protein
MIKGIITFESNSRLDDKYSQLMGDLTGLSGEYSVVDRKDNDDIWIENYHSDSNTYTVQSIFTKEEVEFLKSKYNFKLI